MLSLIKSEFLAAIVSTIHVIHCKSWNLGLTFNSSLCSESHIRALSKKKNAFFFFHNIAHLHHLLNTKDAETLLHAFITTHLDYCNSLFFGLGPKSNAAASVSIQYWASEIFTHSAQSLHITEMLHELRWLLVSAHIKCKLLLLTYKALHGLAPSYLLELFHFYTPVCILRSSFRLSKMSGRGFFCVCVDVLAPKH